MELLTVESDSFANWKERRIAKEVLSPTFEESKEINLREVESPQGKQLTWDTEKATEAIKDVPISNWTHETVRTKLAELDKDSKLPDRYVSIFEKFVVNYE